MVNRLTTHQKGFRMNETPKPMTAARIHSIYAGEKISSGADRAKGFQSTNRFARDPSHPGHAPDHPKPDKNPKRGQ
jgi:hypothetical protein